MNAKTFLLKLIDGVDVTINGTRAWDITVHNEALYSRILCDGSLGFGEAYMDGWWDCEAMDVMFCKLIRAGLECRCRLSLPALRTAAAHVLFNLQNAKRAFMVAEQHYDMDNTMFAHMLGETMNYSCAYWKDAETLDQAQRAKMELICKKLNLEKGMTVLDIGCGWGGLARHMAETRGVRVTAVTVSRPQWEFATENHKGLPITWLLEDYRRLTGHFDRIVSVGMFEHVGRKNYPVFFRKARTLLKDDGLFLLHTIGNNRGKTGVDPWINRYIFPNGVLPSLESLSGTVARHFIMEDWHNFGSHYDKTLMAWYERFAQGYAARDFVCDERKFRMFRYYLLSCAGAFRARDLQLWQLALSPSGCVGGYDCR